MRRKAQAWLLMLLVVPALAMAGTTVYRWVDSKGVVHYSDMPHKGAKRVEIGALTVLDFKAPAPSPKSASLPPAAATVRAPSYQIKILAPAPGTTLWPVNYKIGVRVQVKPPLQGADLLQYQYDGNNVGKPTAATRVELHKVYRGTHTLTVSVIGPGGRKAGEASSTFYVRQHSLLNPQRHRPRPPPKGGHG